MTVSAMHSGELSPAEQMQRLLSGFWLTRALHVAVRLGLADFLQEPRTAEEAATMIGAHAPSLHRLLRFLASAGVFSEDANCRFVTTPLGATLQADVPGSLRPWALVVGEQSLPASSELLHSVKTGRTAFEHLNRQTVWQHRAEDTERGRIFDEAMANTASRLNADLIERCDFLRSKVIVDVGGGDGSLIAAILRAHEHMTGVVFDLPHVAERARARLEVNGLARRCVIASGDALDGVPSGGDAYILARVLHNGDDERSVKIMRNCRRAGAEDCRLLIIERIAPRCGDRSSVGWEGFAADLNMLVMNGGRERTEAEFRSLLAVAGFTLTRILPTRLPMSIIEARAST